MSAQPMEQLNDPPAPQGWGQPVRALFTPCTQPLWRPFWLLLMLAFALRLLAAWHGHWFWRVDEMFQYLEQAHRVVFGYGFIPWEYRHGARTWLTAGMVMPPLFAAKWLGVDHPWTYATMVNSWNALLSMSIPVSSYFIARRMLSEQAARWALVFTCFWYEFIILAPRTLSEIYSTYFFISGLALAAGGQRARWLCAGFLLGLALAFRPNYAPLVGLVAVAGVWHLPRRCAAFAVLGGAAGLLLWGLVDKLTWGGWWVGVLNYIEYVPLIYPDEEWTHLSKWRHTKYLFYASFGLYPLMLLLALLWFRRLWFLWLLVVPMIAIYQLHITQAYSNIFIMLPLLWLITAGVFTAIAGKSKKIFRFGSASVLVVSLVGAAGALPQAYFAFDHNDFFSIHPNLQTSYQIHDFIEREGNTVLVWHSVDAGLNYGGYYMLHHNIPVLYLSSDSVKDLHHFEIWEESGFLSPKELATHIVTPAGKVDPGTEYRLLADGQAVYAVETPPTYDIKDKWEYDLINPVIDDRGKLPPAQLTPYNPEW